MPNRVVIDRSDLPPHSFQSPFGGRDYVLLIVICDNSISEGEQEAISRKIIQTGCRYALCFGHGCSSWDDSIDMAYIEAGGDPQRFVMTTWHDDEPIEDVVDFWWWNTNFDDFTPTEFLVFFLGSDSEIETSLTNRIAFHQKNESEQAD
jgi:hypothetical protein